MTSGTFRERASYSSTGRKRSPASAEGDADADSETDAAWMGRTRMDEIVLRAIAKWPDVPSVYNWLRLDRRGNWLVKGERIGNAAVVEFIGRNYEQDAQRRICRPR